MPCNIDLRYRILLLVAAMMTAGALGIVFRKVSYYMKGKNVEGQLELYDKVWIPAFFMFLGESIGLGVFCIKRCVIKRSISTPSPDMAADSATNFDQENSTALKTSCTHPSMQRQLPPQIARRKARKLMVGPLPCWKFVLATACFSALDLVQATAFNTAMLYISVSAAQSLRGFTIVFCQILAIPLLKRRPERWEIMGVCFAFLGLLLVDVAIAIQKREHGDTLETTIGVLLVVGGQIFSATQYLLEEKTFKSRAIDSLLGVGWEGVCGVILSLCVACPLAHVIPGSDHGSLENYANSLYMSFVNGNILAMNLLYALSILLFKWSGLAVGKSLTSTHRSLFDNLRSLLIWAIMVIIYYSTRHYSRPYGEPLTPYSLLELLGFGVLVLGIVVHNDVRELGVRATCRGERRITPGSPK